VIIINLEPTIKTYNDFIKKKDYSFYILGIDVGGTNTNLGIAGVKKNTLDLLFSFNYKTKDLNSITPTINEILYFAREKHNINIKKSCIGIAGIVQTSEEIIKITNANWKIDLKELSNNTLLDSPIIINDFQSIGYAINILNHKNPREVFTVNFKEDLIKNNHTRVVLGAGTGLGKCILHYNKKNDVFIPLASEGGNSDFPAYNDFEFELIKFIKKFRNITQPVTYEELLSGRGLESIYFFLIESGRFSENEIYSIINNSKNKAVLISKYKKVDDLCAETFRLFSKFYGRCAKNFVLESLATGGLYIAGGIAFKNKDIFLTNEFITEFENAYRRSEIIKKIPLYVIIDQDISLKGACFAAMYDSIN
jgi:glucokinase